MKDIADYELRPGASVPLGRASVAIDMPSGVSSMSWEFEFGAGATWSPHHRYVYRHSGAIKPALGRSRSRPRHFDLSLSGSVRPALPRARPKGNGARPIGEPPCSRCRHGFARRHLCRVDHRARRRQVRAQKRRRVQRVSIRDQFPSLGPRSPVCVFGPHGPSPVSKTADLMPRRTLLLLKSGRRINLLEPLATDWDDKDLAHPLVAYLPVGRAFGLGSAIVGGPVQPDGIGASACARYATADRRGGAPRIAARRRGGLSFWDPISPPKPYLGEPLHSLLCTLGQAIGQRCRLTTGTPEAYTARKQADRLATVSEAFYVVGCSRAEIRDYLEIQLDPVSADPVPPPSGASSMVAVPALMFRRCRTSTG